MPIDFQPIDFQPAGQKENPSGYLMNLYNQWVRPVVGMTGALGPQQQFKNVSNALGVAAQVGRAGNQANQQMAGFSAEQLGKAGVNPYVAAIPGTIFGTVSEANPFLPQNKLSAGLSLMGVGNMLKGPASSLSQVEQVGTKVIQPGPIAKTIGAGTSATTAIPQRYTAGAAADTSILDTSKTPGLKEVGQRYVDYFKKIGATFNEPLFKKWSGKDYFPGDSEIGRIETTVAKLKSALEEGEALKPEELFMGRSAASAAQRSNKAAINPAFKSWAQGAQNQFDQALEEAGHGELKELGRQWFRAKAQDAFQSLLPLNKNMSPNALRSNLLLNELLKTITGPFQGGFMKQSIPSAARVVAMSPYLAGKTLKYGDKLLQGIGQIGANEATPFVGSMLSNALSGNQPQ